MSSRRALERRLAALAGFSDPSVAFEQYATPAPLAAHLIHRADLEADIAGRDVIDLGAGTGVLALGATLREPKRAIGIERDGTALRTARENERTFGGPIDVGWIRSDATRPPLCLTDATVLMNPPFGAQRTNVHADRAFLGAAAGIARVSYSIHTAGSREFLEAFATDRGGSVTHAFAAEIPIDRQFPFHVADREIIDVLVVRIAWSD